MSEDYNEFINELIIKYNDILLRTAIRHMNNINDAEDVINDLWIIVLHKADKLYSHPNKIAWLNKTLSLCIKKYYYHQTFRSIKINKEGKKEIISKIIEEVNIENLNMNQLQYFEQYYEGEVFDEYKDILSKSEMQYLLYKFRDDLSNEEIAEKLGKNYSALTSFGNRIKKKIKNFLKKA